MNDSDVEKILEAIKNSSGNNNTVMIIECVILGIIILKPILMYWIQAKYKADPPHESLRNNEIGGIEGIDRNEDDVKITNEDKASEV